MCTDTPQSDMSPGPGQYTALRTSLDGPAYTMAGRVPEPELFDAPGPGDYDVRLAAAAPVAPAFTMGARWRDEGRESRDARLLPGPGQYQPGDPGSPRAPAYTIGARREATVETQVWDTHIHTHSHTQTVQLRHRMYDDASLCSPPRNIASLRTACTLSTAP